MEQPERDQPKPDLTTRDDLLNLLRAFYGQALLDPLLEPVFTGAGMDLEEHLPRIASFWEVSLLGTGEYTGRPMQLHRQLITGAGLTEPLFERWLELWEQTVSELYAGPTGDRAKREAVRMAAGMTRSLFT
jgi:hemoglobin